MSATLAYPEESVLAPREGTCPDCGARLTHEGGCVVCRVCGLSACG